MYLTYCLCIHFTTLSCKYRFTCYLLSFKKVKVFILKDSTSMFISKIENKFTFRHKTQ